MQIYTYIASKHYSLACKTLVPLELLHMVKESVFRWRSCCLTPLSEEIIFSSLNC